MKIVWKYAPVNTNENDKLSEAELDALRSLLAEGSKKERNGHG